MRYSPTGAVAMAIDKLQRTARPLLDFLAGRTPVEILRKAMGVLRRDGLLGIGRVIVGIWGISYAQWIRRYDTLTDDDRHNIENHIEEMGYRPVISILMAVRSPYVQFLDRALQSVHRQLYAGWQLCLVMDAAAPEYAHAVLNQIRERDTRIEVAFISEPGDAAMMLNIALAMAHGEFMALLGQDDELAEQALYHVVVALNDNPNLEFLYSDEDRIDPVGRRSRHCFKPDWNPDLFCAQNLLRHMGVFRSDIARAIGGFREKCEDGHDLDFALRFMDVVRAENVRHLPFILYHERAITDHVTDRSSDVVEMRAPGMYAVTSYWERQGESVRLEPVADGGWGVHFLLPNPPPHVSILIPTRNQLDLLRVCLDGLFRHTDYPGLEVLVIDNGSDDPATLSYLDALVLSGSAQVLKYPGEFNFAAINNWAARQATGDYLCLLNNDVEPISSDWLKELVGQAARPGIGAVGAMLYYPGDTIQHAGVFLNGIAADHLYLGYPRGYSGYAGRACVPQNLSAVTAACLVVRKSIWDEVGGMDERAFPVAFNDVDFCLRLIERGYRNVWTPFAELYHHESASRGKDTSPQKRARFLAEIDRFQARWGERLHRDAAWNPNLALNGTRIQLAVPPRVSKPWRKLHA